MIQIQTNDFFSKVYEGQLGSPTWWSTKKRDAYGRVMGKGVLTNWGAGQNGCPENKYKTNWRKRKTAKTGCTEGERAMKSVSADAVRIGDRYTDCNNILTARDEAGQQLEDAQGRLDGAAFYQRGTKRRAKLDKTKWQTALSQLRAYYNSGGSTYFSCTKTIIDDEKRKTTELLENLLADRDSLTGIEGNQLLIAIGVGIVGLTFVTLKFIK